MASSDAETVDAYMAELDPENREVFEPVLATIRESIPKGYEEGMLWGMPTWFIPLEAYIERYEASRAS